MKRARVLGATQMWLHAVIEAAQDRSTLLLQRCLLALCRVAAPFGRAPASTAQARAQLFPHVDFKRLRPSDFLRIVLQLIWIALARPQAPDAPRPLTVAVDAAQALPLPAVDAHGFRPANLRALARALVGG